MVLSYLGLKKREDLSTDVSNHIYYFELIHNSIFSRLLFSCIFFYKIEIKMALTYHDYNACKCIQNYDVSTLVHSNKKKFAFITQFILI